MSDKRSQSWAANRLGRLKIHILLNANNGSSDYSRAADASGYPQDHYDLWYTPPHYGHYGYQYEQSWEGYPGIDKSLHSQVQFTANES